MPDFTVHSLLTTPLIEVRDVICAGTCRHKGAVERAGRMQLVFPYRGTYVRHVGDDEVVADASQVLFFHAGEDYQVSHPNAGGDASLALTVDEALLREVAPPALLAAGDPLRFREPRLRIDPRAQVLVALLRHALHTGIAEPLEGESLALTLVHRALAPRTTHAAASSHGRQRLVDRAKLVLARDLARRWTLAEVAAEVGVSAVYLTQSFREVEGVPLYRYQLRLRLARALDLLGEIEDLTALGLHLGFSSHSHFSAAFQQAYGRTPSEFRQVALHRQAKRHRRIVHRRDRAMSAESPDPTRGSAMIVKAYGAHAAERPLQAMDITRRAPGPRDVQIEIAYCGVCHSDLHTVRSEWGGTRYPCVPGHEIVGHVSAVGGDVAGFKVGDTVGVGCLVDSCRHCAACDEGLEQYCENGFTGTYNGATADAPGHTLGGYAQRIVVDEKFVLRIRHPEQQLAAVAPLLCAGITTYSPLRHWNVGPGKKVGIVGIGGLGHMGIKIAHALGAHVVAFTTSDGKRQDAHDLGADDVVISRDAAQMKAHGGSFDFILDTVAASHDLDAFSSLLKRDGTLALVGVPEHAHPSPNVGNLIFKRRAIAGSLIGGIAETQQMLDFCAGHGIVADIEMIAAQDIDKAYDRMVRSDVKYRFVIDSATL